MFTMLALSSLEEVQKANSAILVVLRVHRPSILRQTAMAFKAILSIVAIAASLEVATGMSLP